MKRILSLLGLGALLLVNFASCSDDDGNKLTQPVVRVLEAQARGNALCFTVASENALECACACYKKGEDPLTTAYVLGNGLKVNAQGMEDVVLDNLEWETPYIIKAAVEGVNGETSFCLYEISTGSKNSPFVQIMDGYAEDGKLVFTVAPENAVKCAYVCYKKGDTPPSMDEVLANGIPVETAAPSEVRTDVLKPQSQYVVMVVVESIAGLRNLATCNMLTGRELHGVNLGDGANCYIVREAGKFHFFPLTVKGEKIEGIVKADWIWTTKTDENATKQDLLAEVFWDSGKVNFTTTGQEGNAVLAGFDKTGKIVWVWHIWCTDMPSTMTYASGAAFMDRNLGATSADPAQLKETYGLLWQWGRNVPIFGGYETEWRAENTFDEARKWTILNPAYPYQWTFSTNSVDVQGSLKAPTTFFTGGAKCDWHNTVDLTLWGEEKTDYDPCPAGYHMPTISLWSDFNTELKPNEELTGAFYTYNGQTAWFPAGCGRSYDAGWLTILQTAMVWSVSSEYYTDPFMGYVNYPVVWRLTAQFDPYWITPKAMANRSFGHAVRCISD